MKRALSLAMLIAVAAGVSPASAQDAGNGQKVFNRCRACHAIGPGAHNKVGPALTGIVGRKAGAAPGFNYSDAMKQAAAKGLVWTEGNLQRHHRDTAKDQHRPREDGKDHRQFRLPRSPPHRNDGDLLISRLRHAKTTFAL